jgi:hypothetical protein
MINYIVECIRRKLIYLNCIKRSLTCPSREHDTSFYIIEPDARLQTHGPCQPFFLATRSSSNVHLLMSTIQPPQHGSLLEEAPASSRSLPSFSSLVARCQVRPARRTNTRCVCFWRYGAARWNGWSPAPIVVA